MNFKESIFVLYDLGISLAALSKLYREANEEQIMEILNGDFLNVQFELSLFNDKDIELLTSPDSINKSITNITQVLIEFKNKEISFYSYYDNEYPAYLKGIPSPPFFIFLRGNINLLENHFLCSIVGTRKPSNQTLEQIDLTVAEMVAYNMVVVSGLALGTDIRAHRTTLNRNGKTIAVLPSPIDSVTPKSHNADAMEILNKNGLLISEYYKNEPFLNKNNYIHRNRIISGLSNVVIVAECSEKSGTMHTARFAYKQNRQLFCFNNDSTGVRKILKSNSAKIYRNINDLTLI